MKVQKGALPDSSHPIWMVLDDDYLPVEPIQKYLHYLDSVGRSPNTIQTYAHNLTPLNTYVHLTEDDLMEEYQKYLRTREEG